MTRSRTLLLTAALIAAISSPAAVAGQDPDSSFLARDLEITFLDVGQGDATLVTLGRQAILIDGGRGRGIWLELLERGLDSLAAVIASHNHDDHVGGLVAVVSDRSIGRFYGNGRAPVTDNARQLEEWLGVRKIARPDPPWAPISLGDVRITILAPPPAMGSSSENNNSLGVLIERGSFRALLTGDSERPELAAWLESGLIPDVDVLKAAHHGALDGVSPGWIERTRPEVVVISVGVENGYGHPDPLALRYYARPGTAIYRTDQIGAVTIRVDRSGRYLTTSESATGGVRR